MNEALKSRLRKAGKPVAGVAALAAIMAYASGGCGARIPPGVAAHETGRPLPEGAATHTVRVEMREPRLEVVGTVASEERIVLSARIPAHVARVHVSAGAAVSAGQPIVDLDDREIAEQLVAAEAAVKQAETEFRRQEQLLAAQVTTEQAHTAAEAQYQAARAQADRVRVMMSYARVVSPIDGVVAERRVEAGDLAHPGTVLAAVYDPGRMRLEAAVPLRFMDRVRPGQAVEVQLDRPAGLRAGTVTEILGEVDPVSRTQAVRVRLERPDGAIPGTFGRLWLSGEARPEIRVPVTSVYRVGQLEFVQAVRDGRVTRRLVRTGPRSGDTVEVLSGLSDGDVVRVAPAPEA